MIIELANNGLSNIRLFNSLDEEVKSLPLSELTEEETALLNTFIQENNASEINVVELLYDYKVIVSVESDPIDLTKEVTGIKEPDMIPLVSGLLNILSKITLLD